MSIIEIWRFQNCEIWEIFTIFQNEKLTRFLIFQNGKLTNSLILQFGKYNFEIVRPFKIPHCSRFRQFSYLPFDINQFRRLNFWIFIYYFSVSLIRMFYIGAFVTFQIRNVWHSIIFLFEILTLTQKFDDKERNDCDWKIVHKKIFNISTSSSTESSAPIDSLVPQNHQ